jgi:tRNA pseudouridine55 synthase
MVDRALAMSHRLTPVDRFGLLNVAKPRGLTSRDVVSRVQRLVRPAKVGHAGTLDPLATGVLVVCVGPATRLVPVIQEMPKTYRATFLLGRTSDTDDIEGTVIETPVATMPTLQQVRAALPEFVGCILQTPPAHSAVKVAGKRAYKLARKGEEVELAARPVDVYRIDVLRYEPPEVVLEIECGSGTYVRSIGRDLGERLGCSAVMSELERTAIGSFTLGDAVALDQVIREPLVSHLLPAVAALPHLPQVVVDQAGVDALMNGRNVVLSSRAAHDAPSRMAAIVNAGGKLIALAEVGDDRIVPRQVFKTIG